jgi:hypothetical protein
LTIKHEYIYIPPLDSLSFLLYIIEQVFVILFTGSGRWYEETI